MAENHREPPPGLTENTQEPIGDVFELGEDAWRPTPSAEDMVAGLIRDQPFVSEQGTENPARRSGSRRDSDNGSFSALDMIVMMSDLSSLLSSTDSSPDRRTREGGSELIILMSCSQCGARWSTKYRRCPRCGFTPLEARNDLDPGQVPSTVQTSSDASATTGRTWTPTPGWLATIRAVIQGQDPFNGINSTHGITFNFKGLGLRETRNLRDLNSPNAPDPNLTRDELMMLNQTPDYQVLRVFDRDVFLKFQNAAQLPMDVCVGCINPNHELEDCSEPSLGAFNKVQQHIAIYKRKIIEEDNLEFLVIDETAKSNLRSIFECVVCAALPRNTKIYTCPNQHVLCLTCTMFLQKAACPSCRESISTMFSYGGLTVDPSLSKIYPDMVRNRLFLCANTYVGCLTDGFLLKDIEKHEKYCPFQTFPCPIYRYKGMDSKTDKCNQLVGYNGLKLHLKKDHPNRPIIMIENTRDLSDKKQHIFRTTIEFAEERSPVMCIGSAIGQEEVVAFIFTRTSVTSHPSTSHRPGHPNSHISFSVFVYHGNLEEGTIPIYELKLSPAVNHWVHAKQYSERTLTGRAHPWMYATRYIASQRLDCLGDIGNEEDWDKTQSLSMFPTLLENSGEELTITMRDILSPNEEEWEEKIDDPFQDGVIKIALTVDFSTAEERKESNTKLSASSNLDTSKCASCTKHLRL